MSISSANMQRLRADMLQRESSGNYKVVNNLGFAGGYQMGAAALEDTGYIKSGASGRSPLNSALKDPSAWTGKNGMTDLNKFLNSPAEQDRAFESLAKLNLSRLRELGRIKSSTPEPEVGGLLAAAHLIGAIGASRCLDTTDENGTTGREYFQRGKKACR